MQLHRIERLTGYGSDDVRYYSEKRLIGLVQQYYELERSNAHLLLISLVTACLRLWFGESLTAPDLSLTYGQDFWLQGPDRMIQVWARYTDPHFDVIAKEGKGSPNEATKMISVDVRQPTHGEE